MQLKRSFRFTNHAVRKTSRRNSLKNEEKTVKVLTCNRKVTTRHSCWRMKLSTITATFAKKTFLKIDEILTVNMKKQRRSDRPGL
jgi:hypothetical protein